MLWTLFITFATAAPPPGDSVVMLRDGASVCAGTLVDDAGTIVTAYHCVNGGPHPRVNLRGDAPVRATVIKQDVRHDLAVLVAPQLAKHSYSVVATEPPAWGERVYAYGHPFAGQSAGRFTEGTLAFSVSDGLVSTVGARAIQTSAPINPGNSGGPLLNDAGELVGVISRKLRGDGVAFATRSDAVLALLSAEPHYPFFGGSVDLAVATTVLQSGFSGDLLLELNLRNRLLLRTRASGPVRLGRDRLRADQLNYSDWAVSLGVRQRLDLLSVDLLVGLAHLRQSETRLFIEPPNRIELFRSSRPMGYRPELGLSLGAAGLRTLVWLSPVASSMSARLQVIIDFPGTLWRF